MKSKLSALGLVLILGALIFSGCGPSPAQPTEIPTATPTEVAVEAPDEVRAARDAALAYLIEHYGEQAPAPGLTWTGKNITPGWPEAPVPGGVEYQFTAAGWVVTIGYAVLPPEWTVYQVTVANQTTGFQWEGEVDAVGLVAERLAPEEVRSARDAGLAYVFYHYAEEPYPAQGRTWTEERTTPEGLVGSETFEFTTGDWVVTISYPIVAPDVVVYQVAVANQTTAFWWEGEVDAAGQVTETAASTEPTMDIRDPGRALDVALAYISEHYGEQAPWSGLTWMGDRPPPEEPVGGETIEFTSEPTDWVATVSYGVVAPEGAVYEVVVTNQTIGFRWEGEVDASGQVTETLAPAAGQPVVCWYGLVASTPEGAEFDDYLDLLPQELRRGVGLTGADEAVEAEIKGLRDSGTYVHFWGTLTRDVPDFGGYQLVVIRLRPEGPEGPFFDPDPVEGWTGSIFSTPDDAQFDDYFVLAGNFRVRYGIDSTDATIAAQLESMRDTQTVIRVWGQVTCPAIDVYGTQIQVTQIEVVREAPAEEEGYEGWKAYTSEKFGYTFKYPGECTLMWANPDESIQISGPLVNNERWPCLQVSHFDSDRYHPPAGTDVHQWVTDLGMPYDEIGPEVEIAGLPTLHLINEEGPGWYGEDNYYFIRGDQLFQIKILHCGQEDWELYNKFLQSFTFP